MPKILVRPMYPRRRSGLPGWIDEVRRFLGRPVYKPCHYSQIDPRYYYASIDLDRCIDIEPT